MNPLYTDAKQDDLVGHPLEAEMRAVIAKGIMSGYREGVYGPNDSITRAQFATFLARALELPEGESNFKDVSDTYILRDGISRAASAGLVSGYPDQTFHPNEYITREQMAAMIDRALAYRNIKRTPLHLSFIDVDQIQSIFRTPVSHNAYFGIVAGNRTSKGFEFAPKAYATRAHAAAFINRLLKVIESGGERMIHYQVATLGSNGQISYGDSFMSYEDAASSLKNKATQVIYYGPNIVKMGEGMVVAAPASVSEVVVLYKEDMSTQLTYIVSGTEMKYLDSTKDRVKVQLADTVGYVKQTAVQLIPKQLEQGRSYYENRSGSLYHFIYHPLTNKYVSYEYGKAPSFTQSGQKYYSLNGYDFYNTSGQSVGQAYQYFNYLPLRTKTNYTAEELNRYIEYIMTTNPAYAGSPMVNLGEAFKQAEETYHINALYLFAKAMHESSYGTSVIAQEKKNLFGYQAYDRDPLGNAKPFASFEESIMFVAGEMNTRYLDPAGINFNGAVLGNKSHGMNVRYASDPYWGQKIAAHMYRADRYLGGKDFGHYTIGKTTGYDQHLNVRVEPSTKQQALYRYIGTGYYVALLEELNQADGKWFKLYADSKDNEFGYIHGDYVKAISIVR